MRIIPAHAGQTTALPSASRSPSDHPRACGANGPAPRSPTRTTGSSPRMRGKQTVSRFAGVRSRIIPAHAGQTRRPDRHRGVHADHPRACGANPCRPPIRWMNTGSSPRMRGKRTRPSDAPSPARIIPAHAGQTRSLRSWPTCRPDHPRACGANYCSAISANHVPGSSPRMRGKPVSVQ